MKKVLFTTAFFLSLSPLFAQLRIGVKAGGLFSNFAYQGVGLSSSGTRGDATFSYLAGVAAVFPISDRLSLQTDLLYQRKGAQTGLVMAMNQTSRVSEHLHYLSFTPLLRYRIINTLHLGIGPEVSYLLGVYRRSELLGSSPSFLAYHPLDLAVNAEVHYQPLKKWSVGLRYNLGLYDVTERFEVMTLIGQTFMIDDDTYNRSAQLSLYYWFR